MEQEYNELKGEVKGIFYSVRDIIFALPDVDKSKIEMNLKIIQAVIMRFIRMVIYKKHPGILCTSSKEIIIYATNGFLKHIPRDDVEDRKKVINYAHELQKNLLTVEKRMK